MTNKSEIRNHHASSAFCLLTSALSPLLHQHPCLAFALRPHGAVLEVLLLPDGNDLLEAVDRVVTRVERGSTVPGGDDDGDAGLTDFEPPQAMDHADAVDRKLRLQLPPDLLHFSHRHGLVR